MRRPSGIEADLMERLNVYATIAFAVVAIALLVWITLQIRRRFVDSDDSDESMHEMLTQFRQLKQEGELSEEEYRLIRQRMSARQGAVADLPPAGKFDPNPSPPAAEDHTDPSDS